jgi:hypothetical protein
MSIFKTGLTLDPNSYITAAKGYNELAQIQRQNQQRIDATEYLEKTREGRRVTPDAPDLSAPQSAGLRQMIPTNEDGTYGTPTAPDPENPMANLRLGAAQESRPETVAQSYAQARYSRSKPIVGQLDAEGNQIGLFGAMMGVRPAAQQMDPKAMPYAASSAVDYARKYEVADDIKDRVMTSVDKSKRIASGSNETLSDAERKDVDMYNKNPLVYRKDPMIEQAAQEQGQADYRGSQKVKNEINEFRKNREVKVDNTGRVIRVSDGVQVGMQKPKDDRTFWEKMFDSDVGFNTLNKAAEKSSIDLSNNNYLKEPAKLGRDIKEALEIRQDVAFAARQYDGLAQIAAKNGNMEDFRTYSAISDTHKKELYKQDRNIVYLEGMQSLNELTQGSTGRASKVWSLSSGRDVQIIKRNDGNFDVTIDGQQQRTAITPKRLADELRLQFDSGHRQRLAQDAVDRAKLAFESNLETQKELTTILAQAKTEKMKKTVDYLIAQAKEGKAKLFMDTGSGTLFVNRNGNISAIRQFDDIIGGVSQERFQEVPVQTYVNASGGNAYLNAINQ